MFSLQCSCENRATITATTVSTDTIVATTVLY